MQQPNVNLLKRKGLGRILRKAEHKNMFVVEVSYDPDNEETGRDSLCFLHNKTKQAWMLEALDEGDVIGIELPLKPGRGSDPLTTLLQNMDQPEDIQARGPAIAMTRMETVAQAVSEQFFADKCKKLSGKLRDPRTEQAFNKFQEERGLTMSETLEILVRDSLIAKGYSA
ncbi:hypothetical protein [uncultured Mediterranean phage uvMED]|nr:hypothetical protein [uncultured Mediterranean phage uvMED]BAQ93321.1 hypothetical protein [uncultured Mediterranean phage uvMED]BAR24625.1 hypothetical protein [uncultured Mediterranean phage uvMED]